MNFFDLHCDTLYKAVTEKSELDNPSYEVKLNNDSKSHRLQCYAIWLPDTLDGNAAEKLFFKSADYMKSECNRLGIELLGIGEFTYNAFSKYRNSAFFTVENGKALNGRIENVKRFAELGVRIMTLTWNEMNEIGSGVLSEDKCGLTDFGKLAVADTDYNLCKFKGNAMWGVDLFEESNSAAERRTLRSARRRGLRKRNRIEWLQMLFDQEISKVDNAFFQRLKESCLYLDDKSSNVPYAVFADGNYTDKEFHTDYPTIYHLRKELIKSSQPHDIRLVYLALHHIIKHRGHFLFDNMGSDFESESSFEALFDDLKLYLKEEYEIEFECNDSLRFSEILKDKTLKKTAKSSESYKLFGYSKRNNPYETALIDLMCGRKVKFSDMFGDKSFDSEEVNGITFESGYDDNENTYRDLLQEKFELIEKAKAVYDWAILADILNGEKYISFAKVKTYEEHSSDLKILKKFVKERCKPLYDEIFRITKDKLDNYTAYYGKYKENGRNGVIQYRTNQADFCKYLKKKFEKLDKTGYEEMFDKIENCTFMPKIVVKDNQADTIPSASSTVTKAKRFKTL